MKTIVLAPILLLGLLALPPTVLATSSLNKITITGSYYPNDSTVNGVPFDAKVKVPLTTQRILALCDLEPSAASQYLIALGFSDGLGYGLFVLNKSDKSVAATFLRYAPSFDGDGSYGYRSVSPKGIVILPIESILGDTHATGVLLGRSNVKGKTARIVAGVDNEAFPRFAIDITIQVGDSFQVPAPSPAAISPAPAATLKH